MTLICNDIYRVLDVLVNGHSFYCKPNCLLLYFKL